MLIRLVNPEGEELEAAMETKTVIDMGTCICMNTHICIISEKKRYKYTHIACTQTLSQCRAEGAHTSEKRDRDCHR